jgi:hypothetical protein
MTTELCAICLENCCNDNFIVTHCKHLFHNKCLIEWLNNKFTCPTCRSTKPIHEYILIELSDNNKKSTKLTFTALIIFNIIFLIFNVCLKIYFFQGFHL